MRHIHLVKSGDDHTFQDYLTDVCKTIQKKGEIIDVKYAVDSDEYKTIHCALIFWEEK